MKFSSSHGLNWLICTNSASLGANKSPGHRCTTRYNLLEGFGECAVHFSTLSPLATRLEGTEPSQLTHPHQLSVLARALHSVEWN